MIERIVSGGQTGVDRAALEAAFDLGIPCGGWCPRGRKAEDGVIPARYPLREMTSPDYRDRTQMNVLETDGTLILCDGTLTGGTALTVQLAEQARKPYLVVNLGTPPSLGKVRAWIQDQPIRSLNIAGPRESQAPTIQRQAYRWLVALLGSLDE